VLFAPSNVRFVALRSHDIRKLPRVRSTRFEQQGTEFTMDSVSTTARLLSATFAALLGLGSVAFAGGVFIESPSMQLVQLEPTVVVGHRPGVDSPSKVALGCEHMPDGSL
jgi:hypothetical protein